MKDSSMVYSGFNEDKHGITMLGRVVLDAPAQFAMLEARGSSAVQVDGLEAQRTPLIAPSP